MADARCGDDEPLAPRRCDQPTSAAAAADLLDWPSCTDAAIRGLETFSATNAAALSDLSAAYLVRAQRNDSPIDLLHAYETADRAVRLKNAPPAAQFNRALAIEALGLTREAAAAWDDVTRHEPSAVWADEARARRERLRRTPPLWTSARMWRALRTGDSKTLHRLVAQSPASTRQFVEEGLLAHCAAVPADLHYAVDVAAELRRVTGDPYATDVVNAVVSATSDPPRLQQLAAAHAALLRAHMAQQAGSHDTSMFVTAADAFRRAGSQAALIAKCYATASETRLAELALQADQRGYVSVAGTIRWRLSYAQSNNSSYLASLDTNAAALETFARDPEGTLNVHARLAGTRREIGDAEGALREALISIPELPHAGDIRSRNLLLGEAGRAADALGFTRAALLFGDAAVHDAEGALVSLPKDAAERTPADAARRSALRRRAQFEVGLGLYNDALRDIRLAQDATNTAALQARIDEIEGRAFLRSDPPRAVKAFTRALVAASTRTDYLSFIARLLTERAQARQNAAQPAEGQQDLVAALDLVHKEERKQLRSKAARDSDVLASYFSRFSDTYARLIRYWMENGRPEDALRQADRARAFEVLTLATEKVDEPADVMAIRSQLPAGTFVIEYSVLDDVTYAWVVWHDGMQPFTLRETRRRDVERWAATIGDAGGGAGIKRLDLDGALTAAYTQLVDQPLRAIRAASHGGPLHLVIVPDGALHAIPFAALHDSETKRFLIEDASISIAPSVSLYAFALSRDAALPKTASALLIGNPTFAGTLPAAQQLPRLSSAQDEVRRIAAMYMPHAAVYTGDAATPDALLAHGGGSDVIHIAAHAVVNAQQPSESALLLATSPKDSGALRAADLMRRLHPGRTRLVVLGSCSSAGGRPVGPEGVAPLVRPLIAARIPAVIGTLWDIEDPTAESLLVSFHQHYRRGANAALALQSAQLELLKRQNHSVDSVLSWAPYQVIGYASSPFPPTGQ